jgi:hypothetical protein
MPSSAVYEDLRQIVQAEFGDIVTVADVAQLTSGEPRKLRLHIIDGSFADIFVSATGRYSYHWERIVQGAKLVYRHDNAPHLAWRHVATFPKHFHNGSEANVVASYISSGPEEAVREFCRFIRASLRSKSADPMGFVSE